MSLSNEFLDLVVGLTPPGLGQRYHVESSVPAHDRLVALVLAHLADDEGECTVSRAELCSYTALSTTMATAALHRLVDGRMLELVRSEVPNLPSLHRLVRGELESRQMNAVVRRSGAVDVLIDYGLSVKAVNALCRAGIEYMSDLTKRVEAYRQSPTALECGFDVYLSYEECVRGVGPKLGVALLEAYDAWVADSEGEQPPESATMET